VLLSKRPGVFGPVFLCALARIKEFGIAGANIKENVFVFILKWAGHSLYIWNDVYFEAYWADAECWKTGYLFADVNRAGGTLCAESTRSTRGIC
jgi:hypothetical protein